MACRPPGQGIQRSDLQPASAVPRAPQFPPTSQQGSLTSLMSAYGKPPPDQWVSAGAAPGQKHDLSLSSLTYWSKVSSDTI